MRWLARITGGRPMKVGRVLFTDAVSGKPVHEAIDLFGRRWMVDSGPWSRFRVNPDDEL